LNYDNPEVQEAMLNVALFWLEQGFDGFRLDAIPFLFKREGTSCENLPEIHTFLKYFRREIDRRYQDRLLLAEAVMQPSDLVPYFGDGDECHMCFNFPVTNQLFRALAIEQGFPVIESMQQTSKIPEGCQWQIFLRNHDALIFDFLTKEQVELLIAAYAPDPQMLLHTDIRRRLTPLLGNDPRKVKLIHGMLLSLPGSPMLYYGDEIGMGDNLHLGDRYGLRTPMQWSSDLNAGFSSANPGLLYLPAINSDEYNPQKINVAAQINDVDSFLCWLRRIIEIRKNHRVLSLGNFEVLDAQNPAILAFIRKHDEEILVCINNFSYADQIANLNLQSYDGVFLYDLLEEHPLPASTGLRYSALLPPYGFVWLQLKKR
jgi:maltose alpha-D-glucosyltransferase/alpha-amylase